MTETIYKSLRVTEDTHASIRQHAADQRMTIADFLEMVGNATDGDIEYLKLNTERKQLSEYLNKKAEARNA